MKPLGLLALLCASQVNAASLPSLNLDLGNITVSGLSSGGFMATQFQLSHSQWIKGAGLIASGPYFCARGSINTALAQCVSKLESPIDLQGIAATIAASEKAGKIGPLSALENHRVWLLHGTKDDRVVGGVTDALYQQYQDLGVTSLAYINDKPFAHHFPTLADGVECDASQAPFVGNCNYDAAGEMLAYLGETNAPKSAAKQTHLHTFSQSDLGGEAAKGLADEGYVYIPQACADGETCRVHLNFHGCNQQAEAVGTEYVSKNGLNDWAESNRLVVLYPQTKASMFMPLNPQACWDWWGYTDEHYATRDGEQIRAVQSMIQALGR